MSILCVKSTDALAYTDRYPCPIAWRSFPVRKSEKIYTSAKRRKSNPSHISKKSKYSAPQSIQSSYMKIVNHCKQFGAISLQRFEQERKFVCEKSETEKSQWLMNYFGSHEKHNPLFVVAGTVVCRGKQSLHRSDWTDNLACWSETYKVSNGHLYNSKKKSTTGVVTVVHGNTNVIRAKSETEHATVFLKDYIELLGCAMPNSIDVHLPCMEKEEVFREYRQACKCLIV